VTLRVLRETGDDALARVLVAELDDGSHVECVESVQPPIPREEKWVLIVSTLKGCPVGCRICDAGGDYRGKLTAEEVLAQVELLVRRRYPDGRVPARKLKVQFARMGEPALNDAVLEALRELPRRIDAPGLMACLSTIAPAGREAFFDRLLRIKRERYAGGRFQMQFSLHSTDETARRALVPVRTWSLEEMARYGDRFFEPGDRKVTLNFAPARRLPLEPDRLAGLFSPERFAVKLTPINPTAASVEAGLTGLLDPADEGMCRAVAGRFEALGYETILSIGELRENEIGSNCGMLVRAIHEASSRKPGDGRGGKARKASRRRRA
jgi:23S rRNA (adenine2503-C2)-methyltransferase